jgi:hypothetical protein
MEHDDGHGEGVRVRVSLDRLDGDADRECSKKAGLSQRYYRLYLGVAERVTGISGLVGLARGKQGGRSRFLTAEAPFVDTIFRPTGNNLRSGRVSFSTGR